MVLPHSGPPLGSWGKAAMDPPLRGDFPSERGEPAAGCSTRLSSRGAGGEEAMNQSEKPDIEALVKKATRTTQRFLKMKEEKKRRRLAYVRGAAEADKLYFKVKKRDDDLRDAGTNEAHH